MIRRRVAVLVLAAGLLPLGTQARQDPGPGARSPRNASYVVTAALDPATHTISASGRLTWRNLSSRPAADLRFHLYWNAWRDANSSWMREQALGRNPRLADRPAEDWGGIEVSRLALVGGSELLARSRFIAPDDGNPDDRTVLSVALDRPVAPGETIELDMTWTSRVPRTFARTGRIGSYYFVAHWFPKICVLEDAGWNCHQFHAATEFFSDFGSYDVSLTVPAGWVVGATGVATAPPAPSSDGAKATHRFRADDVHDFAWTTSPDFQVRTERFEEPGLNAVEMRLLLQPEHSDQADRHFAATRAALKYYGTWFGAYPYSHITIVDPVTIVNAETQGQSTGGMEYPMLFTAGTRWVAPWSVSQPEAVTVHEAGHQFWYGVVATNEFEHAWMDEGLNTYSTARVMAEAFPNRFLAAERYFGGLAAWSYGDVPWSREVDGFRLNAFRPAATSDAQSTPTWQYWPGTASATSYNKTALWLGTLERLLGWGTVQKILATHFERGAFRHPSPDEFFAIASEVSGRDLTWFFDAVHRSSGAFDYGVAQVSSAASAAGSTIHTVVVRRFGDGVFPTPVRVTFQDGTRREETWDGRDRWRAFHFVSASPVAKVEVDPDRVLLLDLNYTNNSWSARPRAAEAASKWSLRWLTWLQELMLTYAFFA